MGDDRETADRSELFVALDRIMASPTLGTGTRLRALLRHLVVEELEGRGDSIKAFAIASDIFSRGSDFDPQSDSIVRVEVARLRKALALYNATEGLHDKFRIEIPKGSYRPVFIQRQDSQHPVLMPEVETGPLLEAPVPALATAEGNERHRYFLMGTAVTASFVTLLIGFMAWSVMHRPSLAAPLIYIEPISFSSDVAGFDFIANGLRGDITARLASFRWRSVSQSDSPPSAQDAGHTYMVKPIIQIAGGVMRVRATLSVGPRQLVDWSQAYTVPLDSTLHTLLDLMQEIADKVAVDIGRPMGAVSRREFERYQAFRDTVDDRYLCMLMFRDYWRTYNVESKQQASRCIEAVVLSDDTFAEGHAALSFIRLDAFRENRAASGSGFLLDSARNHAAKAMQLTPEAALPLMASMSTAGCSGQIEEAAQIGRRLVERFPFWPDVLSDTGNKAAMIGGEWKWGLEQVARAAAFNTSPEPWYTMAPAMRDILDSQPAMALERLEPRALRGFKPGYIVRLAAARLAGNMAEITATRQRLAELGYATREAVLGLLFAGCWSEEVTSVLAPAISNAF